MEKKPETSKEALGGKSFFVKTFGCQMNMADSEQMTSILSDCGGKLVPSAEEADVVILNGCEVREKAVHKMLSSLGKITKSKVSEKKGKIIGIGGCVGSLKGSEIFTKNPHIDFVFGTDTIESLPELLFRVQSGERRVVFNAFDDKDNYNIETKIFHKKASAFVNIMKGCDKYCSYCVVPYTRGREKSRLANEVVSDIQRLVLHGVSDVTLLGQNVNSYGKGENTSFPELLRRVNDIPGIKRIKFTSSHPMDFSGELIQCYKELEHLCPQLHLPVQSGSNSVLQKMHRHYKIEAYREQIAKWREICPAGSLTSDMIVGFPTETDEDFEETMKLIEDMKYDNIYAFAYSPRPGTKAAKLVDNVPLKTKHDRLIRLQERALEISKEWNQRFLHQELEVLVEGPVKALKSIGDRKMWQGRTSTNHVVNFSIEDSPDLKGLSSRDLTGHYLYVKIELATGLALMGKASDRFMAIH